MKRRRPAAKRAPSLSAEKPRPAPRRRLPARFWLLLALGVATAWRVAFWTSIHGTPLARFHEWEQMDMSTFARQAELFAKGDWLGRRPYYPYHVWMQVIPRAQWERWHPATMFYQPPLYSYGLAALMRLGMDPIAWARWMQLVLGVTACGLTFGLTRRLFGVAAATAAALLMATLGPLIMVESQILRDGPILAWTLLVLWLAVDALARRRRGAMTLGAWSRRAFLVGLLLGIQAMLHEAAMVLGLLVGVFGAMTGARGGRRFRPSHPSHPSHPSNLSNPSHPSRLLWAAWWVGLLAVGALVGYGPMLARNVAVGAPLGPRYFGSMLALATANHPDNPDHFIGNRLPARLDADMLRAQVSPGKLLVALAADYGAGIGRWPLRWGRRVLALGLGAEVNENLCYAFFRLKAPMLWATTDFYWVWPLALTGALTLGRRRWRARLGGPLGLVAAQGLAFFGMVSMVYPFGRYRLMFLPALAPLAGLAVAKGLALARRRRWGRLAWLGLPVVGCLLAQHAVLETVMPVDTCDLRPAEYVFIGRCYLDDGRFQDAIAIAREGLALFPASPHLNMALALSEGVAAHSKGDYDAALAAWRRALAIDSTNRTAQEGARRAAARLPMQFGHHVESNP